MRNLGLIVKNILMRMFKKPVGFLLHFVLPIVSAIGMFLMMGFVQDSQISIGVADMDHSEISRFYIETLESVEGFSINRLTESELNAQVMNQSIQVGITIPQGFSNSFEDQVKAVEITTVKDSETVKWVKSQSDFYLQNMKSAIDAGLAYDYQRNEYQLTSTKLSDVSKEKDALLRVFGIYLLLIMISTFTTSFKILKEKQMGTFYRIGLSPVHPRVYTFANILANLVIVAIQVAVLLLSLKLVLNISFFTSIFYLYIVLVMFAFCAISVGVLIASSVTSSNAANTSMAVILSPTCMLAGCMWPIEFMPEFLQKIAYITPQRWTLDAIDKLFYNNGFAIVLPNILILIGFTTLFFLLSVYQFKNKELTH